ncbi:MAG: diacylglycerol kinase family lipid kinase [Gemmatimonadetes bacterium]|nr:diacylglycerol kinase family lipid kinase [Gemmatimonadota bacterium]
MSPGAAPAAAGPAAGRTFVILNPAARGGEAARLEARLAAAFRARRAPFDIALTEAPGHATRLAREAARAGYRAVCAVGGDGTLAEVATALAGGDVPLALIPRGTANQVAANLGIPRRLEAAVDVAIHGDATPVDLGRVDGRAFALMVGAGLDAAVVAAATPALKERWGFGAYLYAVVRAVLDVRPSDFTIVADGVERHVLAVSVMVANVGELFASVFPIRLALAPHPAASWRDGLFDVLVVAPGGVRGFAGALARSALRRFHGTTLLHFQAREISIATERPLPVQVDGDLAGTTPIAASIVRGGVRILTPARRP